MLQIRSECAIGTAIIIAAFAGGLGAPAELALLPKLSNAKHSNLVVVDDSTAPTFASTMTATITVGIGNDLLPMIGMAMASREVMLPADVAAIISRNLHNYWD